MISKLPEDVDYGNDIVFQIENAIDDGSYILSPRSTRPFEGTCQYGQDESTVFQIQAEEGEFQGKFIIIYDF